MRLGFLLGVLALAMGAAPPFEIQAHAKNASATTPKRLRVDFYPRRDALRIEYSLPDGYRTLPLETRPAPESRIGGESGFAIDAAGFAWPEAALSRAIEVRPDTTRTDGTYPVLTRVGEGWLVFLPALTTAPESDDVRYRLPRDWAVQEGPGVSPRLGFVFMGPREGIQNPYPGLIVDPSVSTDVVAMVRENVSDALNELERQLGVQRPYSPLVAVSNLPASSRGPYWGDVTPNGFVNLQFAVDAQRTDALALEVTRFVAHEMFHVWNGAGFKAAEPGEGRWLTEGSAEYAAIRFAEEASPTSVVATRGKLVQHLNDCLDKLPPGTGVAAARGDLAEAIRYSCGTAVQWLADLEFQRGPSSEGYFAIWGSILRQATYSTSDFRQRVASIVADGSSGLIALLDGGEEQRARILSSLENAAVPVALVSPSKDLWTMQVAAVLYQNACPNAGGVGASGGRLRIYVSSYCGSLGEQPQIMSVLDISIADAGPVLFEMVRQKCEAGEPVQIGLHGAGNFETREVHCSSIPEPPKARFQLAAQAIPTPE